MGPSRFPVGPQTPAWIGAGSSHQFSPSLRCRLPMCSLLSGRPWPDPCGHQAPRQPPGWAQPRAGAIAKLPTAGAHTFLLRPRNSRRSEAKPQPIRRNIPGSRDACLGGGRARPRSCPAAAAPPGSGLRGLALGRAGAASRSRPLALRAAAFLPSAGSGPSPTPASRRGCAGCGRYGRLRLSPQNVSVRLPERAGGRRGRALSGGATR